MIKIDKKTQIDSFYKIKKDLLDFKENIIAIVTIHFLFLNY